MTHFDAAANFQCAFSIRTGVTRDDVPDVHHVARRKFRQMLMAPVDAGVMVTLVVCATHEIAHDSDRPVGINRKGRFTNGTDVTRAALHDIADLLFCRKAEAP